MPTVRKNVSKLNFQEIAEDFLSMPFSELEKIHQELEKAMRRKKSPTFEKKEKELIDKIKNGGPDEKFWVEFDIYVEKLENETITAQENEKFLPFVEVSQNWATERLKLIIELGKLWNTSPQKVVKRLNITPRNTPNA